MTTDALTARGRATENNLMPGIFECQTRLPGCSGKGFKVGEDDKVCQVCQQALRRRAEVPAEKPWFVM